MEANKKRLKEMIHHFLFRIAVSVSLVKMIAIPIGVITAKLLAQIVTEATEGKVDQVIRYAMLLLLIVIGVKLINSLALIKIEKKKARELHQCKLSFYERLLSQRLEVLYKLKNGEVVERLNDDFKTITENYLSIRPNFYIALMTASIYFIFLISQSVPIAVSLTLLALSQIIPPIVVKRYMQINYDRTREIESKLTDLIVEGYEGLATLKLYGLREWYLSKLRDLNKRYLKIGCMGELACTSENMMDQLFTNLLKYGTYGLIGLFILKQIATLEVGIEAIALSTPFFMAIKSIFDQIPEFAVVEVAEKRVISWFTETRHANTKNHKVIAPYIRLQDITVQHGTHTVFEKMNLELSMNELTMIRGENGVGKSTLMKLIVGLIQGDVGKVFIGGIENTQLTLEVLKEMLFYLPQEDTSFELTPKELIGLMKNVEIENWQKIAIELGVSEKLLTDALITNLSGGERKKIFLALALSLEGKYLLLDEPTNALDQQGKEVLKYYLKQRKGGALMITHDEKIFEISDKTYTLGQEGKVIDAIA